MKFFASLLLALSCTACGPSASNAPTTPSASGAPTTHPASNLNLVLGEFQILDDTKAGLAIHSNGAVNLVGASSDAAIAAITADGTIKTLDGNVVASLGADGLFTSADGKLWFKLDGDTLDVAGKQITIDSNGNVIGDTTTGRNLHVSGASTVGHKRVVFMVLGLIFSGFGWYLLPPT